MQSNTHRITIEAFLIPTLNRTAGPENDPACAAFVFGILRFAWRYAGALRIGNLAIVRKGLTMEVRGEPPADFLAELQRLIGIEAELRRRRQHELLAARVLQQVTAQVFEDRCLHP
mgnify:CR=1 FL=1